MTEKTLVLGFVFLIDHDSGDGAADGSDDSGSDQDFLNNAESRRGGQDVLLLPVFLEEGSVSLSGALEGMVSATVSVSAVSVL